MRRIGMISEHASPVALLGGEDAGGQNVYVDEISRALAALGFGVDVFTRQTRANQPVVVDWAPGVRVINLAAGPPACMSKDDLWPFMPQFRDSLLRFMLQSGQRYDLFHGNFWMSGWVASELRRTWHTPAVQLFHALGTTKRQHQGADDTSPADRIAIERSICCGVDAVIASCPDERRILEQEYDAPRHQVAMIPLGVDTVNFAPEDRRTARQSIDLPIAPDDFVVTYIGRILPRKDVANLIEALARIRSDTTGYAADQIKLVIVGGETREPDPAATPEIGHLQQLAADLEVSDRVIFAGMRSKQELSHFYAAANVMATTPWYEPFGLTVLEAMACGVPVIGSRVGGIGYTVVDGETGILVPPKHPDRVARAIEQVMRHPRFGDQMGAQARRRVESSFSWNAVAEQTATLYERIIRRHSQLSRFPRREIVGGTLASTRAAGL